ncbi:MAG TPA: anaerobic ribonucleoside-triphosphate reductase activating protein [Candidatus Desulfofervidus auxilii]|uniref:Anaerobic ribonucleoside-triphosphate reductase activating protein n=1 Tax=Desulfofervidus auxilii TaxID=1621989 RepID=A0A7C0U222_DESA2|nr:anaerobic ribonucleoside-triphosphate reductase activating protein [Candidatus Desulfofervidus auxilii]
MLNIGGFTPLSTIDYPGCLAAIIYTQGCNFRCIYCHNYRLINCEEMPISWDKIKTFIKSRKRLMDGIVITGGEPTLQKELPSFCAWLKKIGFLVKLDTNGTKPLMLKLLIEKGLIDYIAMDIKAPWHKYKKIIQVDFPISIIKDSFNLIKQSGIKCEFRTTVHSELLNFEDIKEIIKLVGKKHLLCFQIAQPTSIYNKPNIYTKEKLETLIKEFPEYNLMVR